MNTDCTVLVCSCDKYADLLTPFSVLWRKFWPDCPFETVLVTETRPEQELCFSRVVACGKGGDWCGRLVEALETISTPYILMLCDDYYLFAPVDTAGILRRSGSEIAHRSLIFGILRMWSTRCSNATCRRTGHTTSKPGRRASRRSFVCKIGEVEMRRC